jgi:hypothetical protein
MFRNIRDDGILPVANATERLSLTPSDGLVVEQLDTHTLYVWNAVTSTWIVVGGGTGGTNSFVTIQTDSGTYPTATSATDTLDITTNNPSFLSIVGNAITKTVSINTNYTPFSGVYNGNSPTTVTVGGIPAGTPISGDTYDTILQTMLAPYIPPSFYTFSISGQSSTVEVGTTISGSQIFNWGFNQVGNVAANTMSILDVTSSTTLVSGLSITPTASVNVGSIQLTSPGSYSWKGRATNTATPTPATFDSGNFTVSWLWRRFYGTSTNNVLTAAQIQALSSSGLAGNFTGTYSFAANAYKYFAWPDSFGSPTAITGFKDTSNNLPMAMATVSDDSNYSNVQNGWYYALVSVTNSLSQTTNYRLYRTQSQLSSTYNIQVS